MDKQKVCSITPTEFEKYCMDILAGYAERHNLEGFKIEHDKKIKCHNGTYQIDIYATFKVGHLEFKIICECKQYSSYINREKVVILADKVKSLGAQKGVLLATCKFQSGAIEYAKEAGIALIEVFDNDLKYYSFSNDQELNKDDPIYYAVTKYPYKAVERTANSEKEMNIYPTRAMVQETLEEMTSMLFKDKQEGDEVVKAVHDMCEAVKTLDSQHQQKEFCLSLAEMEKEFGSDNNTGFEG